LISLRKQIRVESFTALAEIGVTEKREEILAILKLAENNGGWVDARQVNTELLGRPETSTHGQRILMVVESYGLVEKSGSFSSDSYKITDAGREDLQKREIMVPEQGGYVLHTTKDPLFKEHILRIDRTPDVEDNEARAYFGNKQDRALLKESQSFARPDYLSAMERGHLLRQACKGNEMIQVNSISERVAPSKKEIKASVTLELEPNSPARMKVKTDAKELYADTLFNLSYAEVLQTLTKDFGQLEISDRKDPTLLVKWQDVNPREAENFQKEITLDKPTFEDFGTFEPLKLAIAIFPRTQSDAVQWGNYLLKRGITTYLDESGYTRLVENISAKFRARYDPEELASQLTGSDEMLTQVVREHKTQHANVQYWFLVAPKDLTMK
jgi:hypothetical protein